MQEELPAWPKIPLFSPKQKSQQDLFSKQSDQNNTNHQCNNKLLMAMMTMATEE
jgi:hypothetical protein